MTLDETLSNSQLTKSNLSPNLLCPENHEHQDKVDLLDEYSEVEVMDKTEYAPLPSSHSLFKRKNMDLIANIKNLVEKCYNIKADEQFVSNVNEQVKRLINTVTESQLIRQIHVIFFSDVSDVLLQSVFKLNDDEKLSASITISESQLVIMVKFNPMIKKKVN